MRMRVTALLLVGLAGLAEAHDPGFSTAEVSLSPNAVAVRLVLPASASRVLLAGVPTGAGENGSSPRSSTLSILAGESVRLESEKQTLLPRNLQAVERADEELALELIYSRPSTAATLEFPVLSRLGEGHRMLVSVREQPANSLDRRVLGAANAKVTVPARQTPGFWAGLYALLRFSVDTAGPGSVLRQPEAGFCGDGVC